MRGHAGSERSSQCRLLLLDFTCGLALGGLDRLVGSGVGGNLGFGRGCVLGLILIRPMWTSVDSRLAPGSPARSPLVRMYGSIFMSFRRKAISTLRSPSMACTHRRTRCSASGVATMVSKYRYSGSSTGPLRAAMVHDRKGSPFLGVTSFTRLR
ncbi:hypothetical protein JF55_13815 [Pseudomonas sp. 1-7]|nr:hypothetical protein JF55_13815 [Pseudomonas sp. 1-7]